MRLKIFEHLIAVYFRHQDIEEHQVKGLCLEHLQCPPSVFGDEDLMPIRLETTGENFPVRLVIINHKQFRLK